MKDIPQEDIVYERNIKVGDQVYHPESNLHAGRVTRIDGDDIYVLNLETKKYHCIDKPIFDDRWSGLNKQWELSYEWDPLNPLKS